MALWRRGCATRAFGIPRKVLLELGTIVSPDTLLPSQGKMAAVRSAGTGSSADGSFHCAAAGSTSAFVVGKKGPLKLKDIWAIRVRLQISSCARDFVLFNLAIDSKLRACDLVRLRVRGVAHGERLGARAIVMQE